MAGYIRQSSFSDGDTITAALFNNEYNQLLNAFSNTSGHAHDGTTAEGPVIGLIGDAGETSPNNKVLIDTTNNYIEFYVEVSSSPVQQLYIADGAIVPVTDNDIDLGTSSLEFKDGYFDGTLYADAINFNGTAITSTAAELNILDGVTSTTAELNILDGVTSTTAELNILDGVTSTAAELNILDGVTSTTAELNILDGVTSTATEINIVDGDTAATSTTLADADRVVVNDAGTMVQVALTDFETYFESALDTLSNVTTVGALNSGSITSGFGSIDNGSSAITTTGTITYGSLSDGTITITAFVDEDDMSSDSATLVPTQQSVKAYVDSQVTAQDLDLTTDSGTIAIDLDSETLTIGGTSNEIETSATGNAVTIGIPAAAQITTSLGVGGGSTNGVQISQGAIAIKNGGTQSNIDFYCESSNAHYARLQAPAHSAFSGNVTLTLPATTGTLVGSGDSGTVTNTMLAGSIANSKLSNSTVSFGGISLALGASDATPAFDLSDATNYPTSSLSGTITNAQLAGSIANAKLANSSVTIGSDAIALGGTQTDLNGLTSVDVDNITLDANTISTTNSNGNLVLSPNGTGSVTVPSGYEGRSGFGDDSLVNKAYVDAVANGLDVKASVKVATTANLAATYNNGNGTLTASSNGAISVDGVTLSVNDRVLVKDQSTATQNGFYKVTTVGSGGAAFVLTRTPDADAASELTGGAFTFVEEGTANADNGYVLTTNGTPTLGTTNITFEQFSGAGQIAAGAGLTKTGNTIDAVGTADKITVSANAITIASSYVGQTSITTLGTIATGTWNGTEIGVAHGGTGLTSIAKGSVLVANSANTLSALDGGGSNNGVLFYTASSDTLSFVSSIDGGTF